MVTPIALPLEKKSLNKNKIRLVLSYRSLKLAPEVSGRLGTQHSSLDSAGHCALRENGNHEEFISSAEERRAGEPGVRAPQGTQLFSSVFLKDMEIKQQPFNLM